MPGDGSKRFYFCVRVVLTKWLKLIWWTSTSCASLQNCDGKHTLCMLILTCPANIYTRFINPSPAGGKPTAMTLITQIYQNIHLKDYYGARKHTRTCHVCNIFLLLTLRWAKWQLVLPTSNSLSPIRSIWVLGNYMFNTHQ